MARAFKQGLFRARNPAKYKGNASRIVFRSGWEHKLMMRLDEHPDVLQWSSEEFAIQYRNPLDNRVHRYFPDFWVRMKTKTGEIITKVLEVKPKKETKPPATITGKRMKSKSNVYAITTYAVNTAKWEAAHKYCEAKGWKFEILTEDHLGV